MYRTIFSGMCTAVMGNIWRICVQFPWQSSVRNGIINVEIYHYRGQGEKSVYAWKHRGGFRGSNHCYEWRKQLNIDVLCTLWAAKNWKKFRSGVRYKCSSYSSVKLKSRNIALHKVEMRFLIVQNAESVGVRERKTRSFRGFYAPPPKKALLWMWRQLVGLCRIAPRWYYRHCGDFHIELSGLGDDNIICDFIPVLEITRQMMINTWSQRCSFVWGNPAKERELL